MRRREALAAVPSPEIWPSVTILKPLHGSEPNLHRNLASFLAQDYAGEVEVIFGVGDGADPAALVVEQLQAEAPDRDLTLVVDGRRRGSNGKVSNLINMAERARHDVIVLADSDMLVEPDYLRRLVAEIGRPGVGLVTCLYRGMAMPSLWSRMATQWIDYQFLPSVLVGMALGMAKPCFGSTIALRRDTLDAIGGFTSFKDDLADDYAMGAAVRALGLDVAVPSTLVLGHLCAASSASDLARQELRWAKTIRSIDPIGFVGSIVTQPIPLATLALPFADFSPAAFAVLAFAVASRLLLQSLVAAFIGERPSGLILGPVRDYATFLIFVVSLWPGPIDWRGHRFALQSNGTLAPPDIAGS